MGQRVFVSDAARKILAARDDKNCACDVLPKEVDPEETLPTLDAFRRSMRDAMRSGRSFARAIRRSVRDQMGAGGPSTGGSPERTPGPGDDYTAKGPSFMPNAVGNITLYSRSSTTQQSLNMGQVWGGAEEPPTEAVNAHGFAMGNPSSPTTDRVVYSQIVRPSRRTMDAAKANIRERDEAARRGTATAASINAANRAAWSKV